MTDQVFVRSKIRGISSDWRGGLICVCPSQVIGDRRCDDVFGRWLQRIFGPRWVVCDGSIPHLVGDLIGGSSTVSDSFICVMYLVVGSNGFGLDDVIWDPMFSGICHLYDVI